jgi:hypothetical protein
VYSGISDAVSVAVASARCTSGLGGEPGEWTTDPGEERATHKGALRSCISRRWAWTPERCEHSGGVVIQHALQ